MFKELYGCEVDAPDVGVHWSTDQMKRKMITMELEMGIRHRDPMTGQWHRDAFAGVADDQIFNPPRAGDAAQTIADEFASSITVNGERMKGFTFDPANKAPHSVVQGWDAIRSRLMATIPQENGTRENPGSSSWPRP